MTRPISKLVLFAALLVGLLTLLSFKCGAKSQPWPSLPSSQKLSTVAPPSSTVTLVWSNCPAWPVCAAQGWQVVTWHTYSLTPPRVWIKDTTTTNNSVVENLYQQPCYWALSCTNPVLSMSLP